MVVVVEDLWEKQQHAMLPWMVSKTVAAQVVVLEHWFEHRVKPCLGADCPQAQVSRSGPNFGWRAQIHTCHSLVHHGVNSKLPFVLPKEALEDMSSRLLHDLRN
jgi:hypothetical protein